MPAQVTNAIVFLSCDCVVSDGQGLWAWHCYHTNKKLFQLAGCIWEWISYLHFCGEKNSLYLRRKRKKQLFSDFFWNNYTNLETVIPRGSCVSAINTLWASSAGLSWLGLIYRCCIWLLQGAHFLFSVEQWWVKMSKGESEKYFNEGFLHCYSVHLSEPPS